MGDAAVPALVEVLTQPRRGRDTPEGEVDIAIANDAADVLGDIGDPRAVPYLQGMLGEHLMVVSRALARTPEGVDALLEALGDPNESVRMEAALGLGFAKANHASATTALATALSDSSQGVWHNAANAASILRHADPVLVASLATVAEKDSTEHVRKMAARALRELGR